MHWIILGAIAVTLIVAAGRYPRFAFSVLAILLAFTFVMYQLIPGERERGVVMISLAQVQLSSVMITSGYAGSYKLAGRLHNSATDVALVAATLEVKQRDCLPADASATKDCSIIGLAAPRVVLAVPPGQARDFSVQVFFPSARPRGKVRWEYLVTQVLGRRHKGGD